VRVRLDQVAEVLTERARQHAIYAINLKTQVQRTGHELPINLRPVFCPNCRRHYTMAKEGIDWPCRVKHVVCKSCEEKT
jgi:RNase P subunit RPR2